MVKTGPPIRSTAALRVSPQRSTVHEAANQAGNQVIATLHRAPSAPAEPYGKSSGGEVGDPDLYDQAGTAFFLPARAVDAEATAKPEVMSDGHDRERMSDLPLFRRSSGLHNCVSAGKAGSNTPNWACWNTCSPQLAPFWPHGFGFQAGGLMA